MKEEIIFKEHDQGQVIKSVIDKYLRYWYWFILGLVMALTIAYLYLRYTPKIYTSKAKINVLEEDKGIDLSPTNFFNYSNINLDKEIEILKSYPIVEQVVKNQDLTLSFYKEGDVITSEINNLPFDFIRTIDNDSITENLSYVLTVTSKGFEVENLENEKTFFFPDHTTIGVKHNLPFELNPLVKKVQTEIYESVFLIYFSPVKGVTKSFKNSIDAKSLGDSYNSELIEISYSSQSINKNERILNELIRVFNQDGINDRRDISLRTYEFIDERFITLAEELDSLETDIKDFKQQNKIITIDSKAEAGMTDLSSTQERLFELENQLLLLGILEESLKTNSSDPELLPANMGVSSESVNRLVSEYNELVLEYQKLLISSRPNSPVAIALKDELTSVKKNIFASINSLKKQLNATKSQVEQKNQRLVDEVYNIPASEKIFLDIKRQQEIKQELYVYLLQKREEAAINYAITEPSIKVVEYALSSEVPISPNSKNILILAAVGGLAVPFGIIFLYFLLDTKIKNKDSVVEVNSKNPVVGELPQLKKEAQLSFISPNDTSIQAEAYRVLSYNLGFGMTASKAKEAKVIYCTSTIKGEGKTHVSINLSLAFSSIDKKVLLIGADLRNPQVHNFIGQQKDVKGLSNYLYDPEFNWKSALIQNFEEHPNHDILLSGDIPPNPSIILTNGRLQTLFEEAKKEYDYIIVDTAPTLLVSDTLLISALADTVVYITRANYTEKKLLNYSRELSESGKLKNMVYVVNAIDLKKANSYGYGYGYNYGYNYGYGSDKKK